MSLTVIEKLAALSDRNLLDIERAKENGTKVAGMYCMYAPKELVIAAGAIPVPLCGTRNEPIGAAEKILPRNLCPLIKSSFGFAVTDSCPFFHASDLVIGETTCDGKKKMFELLQAFRPVHVMQLPQNQEAATALPYWLRQIELLKEKIEAEFQVTITPERLGAAIRLMNRERMALKELMDLAKTRPSPLSGLEVITIEHRLSFLMNKDEALVLLREAKDEIRQRALRGDGPFTDRSPRILLTGTPVGLGSEKVLRLIEEEGGSVVVSESCSGYKKAFTVEENGDPLTAIAKQYLQIPCSCMSPNPGRYGLLGRLIEEFEVDGVVDLGWQACHTYIVESCTVQKFVTDNHNLPYLRIETDYSEADSERLRVRIEAFLEMTRQ